MKQIKFLLVSVVLFMATGCPDYDKVREMSREQLAKQKEFMTFFKNYTDKVYIFSGLQIDSAKRQLTDKEKIAKDFIQQIGDGEIAGMATAAEKDARRQLIGRQLLENEQLYKGYKDELDALLVDLKTENTKALESYQVMIEAQTELDNFVKLKRFDELAFDQVMQKLNVGQDGLKAHGSNMIGILDTVTGKLAH